MEGSKGWWESKTVWGAVLAVAGAVLPIVGEMGADFLASEGVKIAGGLAAVIGGILAIYGRYKAVKQIGSKTP